MNPQIEQRVVTARPQSERERAVFGIPEPHEYHATHKLIERASGEISKLCHNPSQWRMCVPVQPDDSDILFSKICELAEREINARRDQIEVLRGIANRLRHAAIVFDGPRSEEDEAKADFGRCIVDIEQIADTLEGRRG